MKIYIIFGYYTLFFLSVKRVRFLKERNHDFCTATKHLDENKTFRIVALTDRFICLEENHKLHDYIRPFGSKILDCRNVKISVNRFWGLEENTEIS